MADQISATAVSDPRRLPGLTPVTRASISDEVVKQLASLILDHGLRPGDRLPSERELMSRLSIGRSSLREAVKVLRGMGVIDVTLGEGMFVGRGDGAMLAQPLGWGLLLNEHSVREVIETRRMVELEVAGLAAQRASAERIVAISERLEPLRASQAPDEYARMDMEFHMAVAHAAGNRMMTQILETVRHLIHGTMGTVALEFFKGKPGPSYSDHVRIYEAIRAGDVEGARRETAQHLDAWSTRLLSVMSKSRSEWDVDAAPAETRR